MERIEDDGTGVLLDANDSVQDNTPKNEFEEINIGTETHINFPGFANLGLKRAAIDDSPEYRAELMQTVKQGRTQDLEKLLDKGGETNFRDEAGSTPLIEALKRNDPSLVEAFFLCSPNSEVNFTNQAGETPLIVACKLASISQQGVSHILQIVQIILNQHRLYLNVKDNYGMTALMYAASGQDVSIVRALLNKKAEINLKNKQGQTALHLACLNNNTQIGQLLVDYGARIEPDLSGKTPIDVVQDATLKKYLIETPLPCQVTFISTKKYKPTTRRPQLGITTLGSTTGTTNLERDLMVLTYHGCNVLVTALSDDEIQEMRLTDLSQQAAKMGIECIRFPIQKWLPRLPIQSVLELTDKLSEKMKEGKVVLFHTDSGRGRAGLLAACMLVRIGFPIEEAESTINDIDTKLLQNPSYHLYISNYVSELELIRDVKFENIYAQTTLPIAEGEELEYQPTITSEEDAVRFSEKVMYDGLPTAGCV